MNKVFFHIGLPKTGTTTIQYVLRKDRRLNVVGSRFFNRFEYWEKPASFLKNDLINLVSEENQILQQEDFGKLILFLARIRKFNPNAQIILTIREQRAMLESRYKYQFYWDGGYTGSFAQWLKSGQGMDYLSISMYATVYETILTFFPKHQIHFLLFEDLKNDFAGFFERFYHILGLPPNTDLVKEKIVQNKSLSEPELLAIKGLNQFKLFKQGTKFSKYEFALYKKIAALKREKREIELFRWKTIAQHEVIEADFAYENRRLIELGLFSRQQLEANNYLI